MLKKKIIISISGGIDSSTTLLILKKNMYYIEIIFIKNWINEKECTFQKDLNYVKLLCKKTNIKLHIINTSHYFWSNIFLPFINKLKNGFTPNPDIECNTKIKFNKLLDETKNKLNFDTLATGHYAKSIQFEQKYSLMTSFNIEKDQTYFLSNIKRSILKFILFPISNYTKKNIKQILKLYNFINYNKKNSTGICFIENNNFKLFLKEYIPIKNGIIYDNNTNILGHHNGVAFYTIGEKLKYKNSTYKIYKKNNTQNILYATKNNMQIKTITINKIKKYDTKYLFDFKIRHQAKIKKCILNESTLIIKDKNEITSPGQYIVLYKNKECISNPPIIKDITFNIY